MAAEVRGTVDSADKLAQALSTFVQAADKLTEEAEKIASAQESKAARERDARLRQLQAARKARQRADAALAACIEYCQGLQMLAAQARAQEAVADARYQSSLQAVAILTESRARLHRAARSFRAALERAAPGARTAAAYRDDLRGYLGVHVGSVGASGPSGGHAASVAVRPPSASSAVSTDAPLADVIDDREGNIRFEKVSRKQVEWGLETLTRVVQPAVRMGKGSDYFMDRDRAEGLDGERSYSGVYRWFYSGDHAIKLSRQPGGKLEVINGYHRIVVARELGIRSLPAVVQ